MSLSVLRDNVKYVYMASLDSMHGIVTQEGFVFNIQRENSGPPGVEIRDA